MNQLQHFGQHKTTVVVTRHVSWAQIITKIALRPGLCPGPTGKSYVGPRGRFAGGGGKGKEGKNEREGRNDEKGVQEGLRSSVSHSLHCSTCQSLPPSYLGNGRRQSSDPYLKLQQLNPRQTSGQSQLHLFHPGLWRNQLCAVFCTRCSINQSWDLH